MLWPSTGRGIPGRDPLDREEVSQQVTFELRPRHWRGSCRKNLWVPHLGNADTGEPDSTTPHHPILGRVRESGQWRVGGSGVPAASVGTQFWVWKAGNKPRREIPSSSVSSLSPTRQNRRAWQEKHQGTLDPLLLLHSCGSKGHLGSCGRVLLPERTTHAVQTVLESSQPFHQWV